MQKIAKINLGGQPAHVDMGIPMLKYPLFHVLIHYPSALFILCISVAVRWKMKCFGLGWKRKHNLVLSPWIWIFLAYQCQVSPLTNKWMYVTKFSSLDHAIFRCCNVTWHVTCDGCDTMRSIFFLLRRIQYYIMLHNTYCAGDAMIIDIGLEDGRSFYSLYSL